MISRLGNNGRTVSVPTFPGGHAPAVGDIPRVPPCPPGNVRSQASRRRRNLNLGLKRAAVRAELAHSPEGGRAVRVKTRWDIRDGPDGPELVPFTAPETWPASRVRCGRHRRGSGGVAVKVRNETGRAYLDGLHRCGSVWACPVCASRKLREKGSELAAAVAAWEAAGPGRVYMVTLTARHAYTTDPERLRDAVTGAWRAIWQGRAARYFRELFGIAGWVKRVEVTLSRTNGSHPHLHALVFTDRPLEGRSLPIRSRHPARRDQRPGAHNRTMPAKSLFLHHLYARWRRELARRGFDCLLAHRGRPVAVTMVHANHAAEYVTKMGLGAAAELASHETKRAGAGSRTMLRVLADYAQTGNPLDGERWQTYCETWRGRRSLEWSRFRGCPPRDIEEADDPQEEADLEAADPMVAYVPPEAWDGARWEPLAMQATLIDAVENRDTEWGRRFMAFFGARETLIEAAPDGVAYAGELVGIMERCAPDLADAIEVYDYFREAPS